MTSPSLCRPDRATGCRFSMLLGIGLSQGITLGQLISLALDTSGSGIILMAFAGGAWVQSNRCSSHIGWQ